MNTVNVSNLFESGKYDASDKSESGECGASRKSDKTGESGDAGSYEPKDISCYIALYFYPEMTFNKI